MAAEQNMYNYSADRHVQYLESKTPGRNNGFSRRCASLVKEQRARLYILRRCATMLLCWYIQGDE
ncbi:hypothetical protein AQUCO_02000614v1 [Aquilegia coerulea]|uniref:Uncharacterized protein n=1 Tax=Aquilegia coerulea TaxID=218851 RepID=A0A2G5DIH3_AQUCA|nr:hypothetical protein AQUCO_02000614v1 [Aquilegia coerulea]